MSYNDKQKIRSYSEYYFDVFVPLVAVDRTYSRTWWYAAYMGSEVNI